MAEIPQFITELGKGLLKAVQLFEQGGAPPEIVEKLQAIAQEYGNIVEQITGGQNPEAPVEAAPQEAPPAGVGSPEAAGNARPV